MFGMATVYAATNRYIDQVKKAYEEFSRCKEHQEAHPTSQDAKKQLAIAQVTLDEVVSFARQQFQMETDDGISAMRKYNKARKVEEPTIGQINILTALKMIPHPSDEFLYGVVNTLKGNRLCLMALDAIVRAAWADDPDHECKRYSDMLKPEMTIKAADEAITKLKKFCDKLVREDIGNIAGKTPYANAESMVISELNVDPEAFFAVVTAW